MASRKSIAAIILLAAAPVWSQSHRLEPGQLVVEPSHWASWSIPSGTAEVSESGVRPRFIRDRSDATIDASLFLHGDDVRGGIRAAGSNPTMAGNVIDGRLDTYWEPDLDDPLQNWWVEIDLGRLVWAKSVVIKFADEGVGDPFTQFRILTSTGRHAFLQSKSFSYRVAGRTEGLTRTQREYVFDLTPSMSADPDFSGDVFQYLQILATASDLRRSAQVTLEAWQALPETDRGDVVYFRRESSGLLREVDQNQYEAIDDPELLGPIHYFRRERPRLAEVEVWTAGDNLVLGAGDRGGGIKGYGSQGAEVLTVDGDFTTFASIETGYRYAGSGDDIVFQDPQRSLVLDLGAWYWLKDVVMVFDPAFRNYGVHLSDGRLAPDRSRVYQLMTERGRSPDPQDWRNRRFHLQANTFTTTKARYLKIDYQIVNNEGTRDNLREMQLYGRGYLPQVTFDSGLIELGGTPSVLSNITWEADLPPTTQLQIRTRTGNEIIDDIRYYTNTGLEVTPERYRKLLSFQKGDSTITPVPGPDWSNWSPYYQVSGAPIASPSPRRYVMIEATMLSEDPDRAALLRGLTVGLDDPLANRVIGEMAPGRVSTRGQREIFTLYLRPNMRPNNLGFDQILVNPPPATSVQLVDVQTGTAEELDSGTGRIYEFNELQVSTGTDSLWLRLPEPISQSQTVVALRFASSLYLASNPFIAQVGLGDGLDRVWQRVDAGDATDLVDGSSMTVFTPFDGDLIGKVEVTPNPFTPNGDGVNDEVRLNFPVYKLIGANALVLEVFALNGRLVTRLEQPVPHAVGQQELSWDGRNQSGSLAPPGLYLCRVGLDVDAGGEEPKVSKVVASVY